jgi:3',5'-cyclic AMP phosphodiesterase CpdA
MSVRVVVGNHDHRTQTDRQPYEDSFPNSINYHFTHGGWQFVGIDTSDGTKSQTSASATTLRWLDDELPKLDKQRPTVLFTHFPLGPLTPMRVKNADEVLGRFKEFNLQAVYNGHFHGFTERTVGKVTVTTNRCCSFHRQNHDRTKEKGFFVCQAKDGKITRTFVEAML